MVATRGAGGYGGRGNTRFTWYGNSLAARMQQATEQGTEKVAQAVVSRAKSDAAVDTGEFRDGIGYEVRMIGGGVAVAIFAAAPHSVYVILGTSKMPARDPIRPAIDAEAPKLASYVRAEIGAS
jgi:HK97 gp10 family phage protein